MTWMAFFLCFFGWFGIAPLMPIIRDDLQVPFGVAGLLTTIPVLCMGLFAPLGPWLGMKLGPRLALTACVGIKLATTRFTITKPVTSIDTQVLCFFTFD